MTVQDELKKIELIFFCCYWFDTPSEMEFDTLENVIL